MDSEYNLGSTKMDFEFPAILRPWVLLSFYCWGNCQAQYDPTLPKTQVNSCFFFALPHPQRAKFAWLELYYMKLNEASYTCRHL